MEIVFKNGIIFARQPGFPDRAIGSMFDSANESDEMRIKCAVEVLPLVEDFVKNVNTGKFKPKTTVKQFEEILNKYAEVG